MRLVVAAFVVLFTGSRSAAPPQTPPLPLDPGTTVVRLEWTAQRTRMTIDGKPCGDCLAALEDVHATKGASQPVIVIMDDHVELRQWQNTSGLMGKAGLQKVRYFDLSVETQKITELLAGGTFLNVPRK
jgi:hypothetical protein